LICRCCERTLTNILRGGCKLIESSAVLDLSLVELHDVVDRIEDGVHVLQKHIAVDDEGADSSILDSITVLARLLDVFDKIAVSIESDGHSLEDDADLRESVDLLLSHIEANSVEERVVVCQAAHADQIRVGASCIEHLADLLIHFGGKDLRESARINQRGTSHIVNLRGEAQAGARDLHVSGLHSVIPACSDDWSLAESLCDQVGVRASQGHRSVVLKDAEAENVLDLSSIHEGLKRTNFSEPSLVTVRNAPDRSHCSWEGDVHELDGAKVHRDGQRGSRNGKDVIEHRSFHDA